MAWWGMLLAEVGVPLTPMFAHILARAVDETDFRPSRSGGATMPTGGRAQAERVSARDGAPAQAACPSEIRCAPALQLAPVACTHECNSHLSTFMRSAAVCDSPRFFFSKDFFYGQFGRLTRECRARAARRAYKHPIGHVHLVQQISTLGIERRGDRWSGHGDSGHGATNEGRRHLTAICELAR
jgi:hypothetical protein